MGGSGPGSSPSLVATAPGLRPPPGEKAQGEEPRGEESREEQGQRRVTVRGLAPSRRSRLEAVDIGHSGNRAAGTGIGRCLLASPSGPDLDGDRRCPDDPIAGLGAGLEEGEGDARHR